MRLHSAKFYKLLDSEIFQWASIIIAAFCLFSLMFSILVVSERYIEIPDDKYHELSICSTHPSFLVLVKESMIDSKVTYSEFYSIKEHCDYLSSNKLSLETLIQGGE
ncbi:hypothetical protein [Aliivibrio fischeri]|uniref:hypothetical protein n=1 Tax=Aliivibrio fischeri TaxID=668 RepID=UPI0007C575F3|nr:hypothetical protein [Aliivibrio fischeri]